MSEYVDYTSNGANWPTTHPACGDPNQSPIDLSYEIPTVSSSLDNFQKHYENIVKDSRKKSPTKLEWSEDKSTLYVKYDEKKDDSIQTFNWYFTSNYASDYLWGPKAFFGV